DRPAGVGPAVPADRTRGKLPPAHLPRPGGHRPGEVGAVSVVLSLILWVPVAGAVALLFVDPERVGTIRRVALAASLLAFAASLAAALAFDRAHAGVMQFVEVRPWIPSIGVTYHLGADGLSLPLVVLTTLLTVLCVIYSWRVDVRPKEYMIVFILLESGMVGVFLALDFFLLYFFWELSLIPMYFIIAIWGGPRRAYAAIKFFLYTLVGSLAMLLAILIVYFHSSPPTFDILALIRQQPLRRDLPLAILAFWGFFLGFRSEEHTSELQSRENLVCRLLLEKKKKQKKKIKIKKKKKITKKKSTTN